MKNNKIKIPPGVNPKKIKSEAESRKSILNDAKLSGCHEKIVKIFARYDEMLAKARTEEERESIAIMGSAEIYRIFGLTNGLNVNGKDIIPNEAEEVKKDS